ncbi:MAG: cell division protein ZipA [Kiritimatiellia bacterium]|jgi:cell division protein ZipA
MNGRELVILLLGLAIVAVVLRGLYVALNARRGQIKLAIDKNIPQNVDLESLELAELPGGGARVVTRSLEEVNRQNNALDLAETKAQSLNLADAEIDGHIPVLMDAVELSEPAMTRAIPTREYQQEVEVVEDVDSQTAFIEEPVAQEPDDYAGEDEYESSEEIEDDDFSPPVRQEHSIGEDWDEDETEAESEADLSEPQARQEHFAEIEDEADSVLFDHDEEELEEDEVRSNVDTMSSVAPDYVVESEVSEEVEALSDESAQVTDDDSYEDQVERNFDDALNEQAEQAEQAEQEEEQPALFDADSSADGFSMSAGERIGANPASLEEANQSGLFDDIDEHAAEVVDKPKSKRSLFSLFGRKSKRSKDSLNDEQQTTPVATNIEMEALAEDEPDDVLFEEVHAQVDIEEFGEEESVHAEPAYVDPIVDEDLLDELDFKRSASLEVAPEEQKRHSDEFEHSEVLVLNVTAKDGRVFAGDDLLQVLITSGLKFGEMNIFHKRLSKEQQSTVIFSVANMLNPGTFDLNNMDEFTTLGISFFLALPTPINNLDAFEQMLGVAQEIRDTLGGDLKDDHRNGMTGQTIEHYRQRIRDFELRRLKAVAARG